MIDYEKEYRQIHRIAAELHLRNDRLLDRLDSQKEEIEKLRAENERLREALREAASLSSGCPWCKDVVPPLCCNALEGKP